MVAGFNGNPNARAFAECVGESECERADCSTYDVSFFPETACAELEVSMAFPTCWDGVNIDSEDHMQHVSYDVEGMHIFRITCFRIRMYILFRVVIESSLLSPLSQEDNLMAIAPLAIQ